jgi:hypothetical protein
MIIEMKVSVPSLAIYVFKLFLFGVIKTG